MRREGGHPIDKLSLRCAVSIVLIGTPADFRSPVPHSNRSLMRRGCAARVTASELAISCSPA